APQSASSLKPAALLMAGQPDTDGAGAFGGSSPECDGRCAGGGGGGSRPAVAPPPPPPLLRLKAPAAFPGDMVPPVLGERACCSGGDGDDAGDGALWSPTPRVVDGLAGHAEAGAGFVVVAGSGSVTATGSWGGAIMKDPNGSKEAGVPRFGAVGAEAGAGRWRLDGTPGAGDPKALSVNPRGSNAAAVATAAAAGAANALNGATFAGAP
ncbi:hypothetical protein Vafri_7081, partial [Volvox africanus]